MWGFSDFRPLQREAMHAVLEGRDSLVVLPTGGGKSLCFQAPALVPGRGPVEAGPHDFTRAIDRGPAEAGPDDRTVDESALDFSDPVDWDDLLEARPAGPPPPAARRQGFALVVSPLISLMKDQVDGLRVDGVEARYLNSTQTGAERDEVFACLRADRCRLLYVSPERLVGEGSRGFRRMLSQYGLRFVAIDEAHCISQWGHDFRPEYRQLGRLRDDFPGASFHAFTATATERVRHDILTELRLVDPLLLVGSFDRPNLVYRVLRRGNLHKQLEAILSRHDGESGIVYCGSRKEVESLADWLRGEGHEALPYHAGLSDEVRARHQEAFLEERADIVVATVAFGMGIDRSNVRFVVHASAPRSPEHYQQEAGRAGRDGLPAECVLIYSGSDFVRWRQMLEQNGEYTESARALLRDMERYAAGTRCRHRALVEYFGETWTRGECGACDWCLKELDSVDDSTTVARKILSCVARLRQGYGLAYVAEVLLGKASDKVVQYGHAELSTFGLLKQEPASAVRGYIEQLVAGGWLARAGEPYPVLRLTVSGAALLKGEGSCELFRELQPVKGKGRTRGAGAATFGGDPDLFDRLREVRTRIARERGVPPYVIFHDTTLKQMAERRPSTLDDLYDIYGVGAKKAADFGDAFLDAIRLYRKPE
ncbi:MAG TPA: RecQ family ATP-dependent DNA helicase [Vicinamibacterales bacterium]|nr:RecQ family ATP-dependent DNA helicase [Vicinamibacterales bacterium]